MAGLVGFCGAPAPGLLARMQRLLRHRVTTGWTTHEARFGQDGVAALAHATAPWAVGPQLLTHAPGKLAMAHTGALFAPGALDLEAIAQAPEEALARLEGAFAAAFVQEDTLHLIRDHAGIKVLYWTQTPERLLFASEIKALFADPGVPRTLRQGALPEYLTFSFIPGENTMFAGIQELQPGHTLRFRDCQVRLHRHFVFEECEPKIPPQAQREEGIEVYAQRLRSTLEDSVRTCCAVSPRPPVVFLSGGLDSSAILALTAREYPTQPIDTISIHFGDKYPNENEFVSMMTARYETRHHWLQVQPKGFLQQMREIIWYLDDPIGDPVTVPNFLLAQRGASMASLALNGEGGDPCFGGPKNIGMMLSQVYGPATALGERSDGWLERVYLSTYRRCYSDLNNILTPDAFGPAEDAAMVSILRPFLSDTTLQRYLNQLMAINIRLKGANLILPKVDKMSSTCGILALAPLFTKAVIEESMRCPPAFKLQGHVEKSVLKFAMQDLLPAPIIQRPKSGMRVPVRHWLQKEMRRFAKRILSPKRLQSLGFFQVEHIRQIQRYDAGDIWGMRYGLKLWMLITFVLWYEQMVEADPNQRDL